jgi:hypothetical protein
VTLHRTVLASVALVSAAALVLTGVAVGSTHGRQKAAKKSPIAIRGRLSGHQNASFTYTGRFVATQVGVILDSGSAAIRPSNGTTKIVDGQRSEPVIANSTLKGKKGNLGISMRGVSIEFDDLNPTKDGYAAEYGTWKITVGSGSYEGWTGGGRWASVGIPTANHIEWDGFVTQ